MIQVIPNQPINIQPYEVDDCNVGDRKQYCTLLNEGDPLFWQAKQTPCGDNLVADGDFTSDIEPAFWTAGTGWNLSTGEACHSPGTAGNLTQEGFFDPNNDSGFYQITFTVSGMTAGELTIKFDSDPSQTVTQNGIYTLYFDVTGSTPVTLKFEADADFDGCVSDITGYEMNHSWEAYLADIDGDEIVSLDSFLSYDQNFVTLYIPDTSDISESEGENMVNGGCYRICINDPCDLSEVDHILNGGFSTGPVEGSCAVFAETPPLWYLCEQSFLTSSGVDHNANSVRVLRGTANDAGGSEWTLGFKIVNSGVYSPNLDSSINHSISIDLTSIAVRSGKFLLLTLVDYDAGKYIQQNLSAEPYGTFTQTYVPADWTLGAAPGLGGFFWVDGFSLNLAIKILNDDGSGMNDDYRIDNVSLTHAESTNNPYCSQCISVKTEHDCAKVVEGIEEGNKLGFNFDTDFRLWQRLRVISFNPEYPVEDETYDFSSGSSNLSFGARKKFYTAKFDYMGETEHDTLSTQMLCSNFQIEAVRYTVRQEDYKPEWDKEGGQRLAQSRILISKYGTNIRNSNC